MAVEKGLEVIVATMGRKDLSLYREMNIQCDALIANQCDGWGYEEAVFDGGRARMFSTPTVGVGKNRNFGIELSEANCFLFADDDVVYYDGVFEGVMDAFRTLPDADVIFFGMDMTRSGRVFEERRHPVKRLHLWNSLKFGAGRMAVRRDSLERSRISFSHLFGGGARYGSGEDTLFIRDCFKSGMKVYSHSLVLGTCAKDASSWFEGFNEKFFFDKGALLACAFPVMKHFLKFYFAWRFSKKTKLAFSQIVRHMSQGISSFEAKGGSMNERRLNGQA